MYFVIRQFLQPFPIVFLLLGLAVANLWRKRIESRRRLLFVTVVYWILLTLCLPLVSHLALGSLEWGVPRLAARPESCPAIVVLGGGMDRPNDVTTRSQLSEDTLFRCLHAAELYSSGEPCLVFVSGGKLDPSQPGPTSGQVMKEFLVTQRVRPVDLVVEHQARTTHENAVNSARLLQESGIDEVVLVTDASHMCRAAACFRRQGIGVIPSGCRHRAVDFKLKIGTFLPSPDAAKEFKAAFHEWLGICWYWFHGRLAW